MMTIPQDPPGGVDIEILNSDGSGFSVKSSRYDVPNVCDAMLILD
jgi:hypothetical protein